METLLITVTLLSLALALAMAAVVLKMMRDDRRRSDARVAALAGMAAADGLEADPAVAARPARRDQPLPSRLQPAVRAPRVDVPSTPLAQAALSGWEAAPAEPSALGTSPALRIALGGGLAAAVLAVGFFMLTPAAPGQPEGGVEAAVAAPAPLELLSLRHEPQADGLAISGVVQNPQSGSTLTGTIATVFLFGADGTTLASGRAPLDFTSLAPGAESPFLVHVPVAGAVARYRIGFRTEDGGVIAHVDKRSAADAVARK